MTMFFTYVFLGLSLAAPIGPVNAAQLDSGIKNGFLHSWLVGLGASVGDSVYMLLVFLGVVHLVELPFVQSFLWLFGFFVLVYTGIDSLKGSGQISMSSSRSSHQSHTKSFLGGFFIALFNPISIMFWLGIFGSILAKTVHSYGVQQVILYVCAIFIGIAIWDFMMALLASTMRRYLTTGLLKGISILSGLSLIGFGVYFGIQAATVLF